MEELNLQISKLHIGFYFDPIEWIIVKVGMRYILGYENRVGRPKRMVGRYMRTANILKFILDENVLVPSKA
jgi:hypothetical protein